ncbi:exosome complex exonuclease Rrp41 [Candidatus Woesearchaeota archaeon]|nr:exosome complex exonuclease Rrp41 [Candidatus Woesearchaeota archaeon]
MVYAKRNDGRKWEDTRKVEAKVGVIKRAVGSAMFKIGDTIAIAAVYGPRSMYPRFLQDPECGTLRCHYNMMPFSAGERVRPGGSRRSKEISLVTEKALIPVIDLNEFPNAVVDVFIEFPQTDAGSRCAGICAASMALADAGISMKHLVSAVAVGRVGGRLLVDLDYSEESHEEGSTDIATAYVPGMGFSLLQMDGEVTPEELQKLLEMSKQACEKLHKVQEEALKSKYETEKVVDDE